MNNEKGTHSYNGVIFDNMNSEKEAFFDMSFCQENDECFSLNKQDQPNQLVTQPESQQILGQTAVNDSISKCVLTQPAEDCK